MPIQPTVDTAPNGPRYSGRLKRLDSAYYHGRSYVHWTFCLKHRETGWLNPELHNDLIAELSDWLVRYHLCCYAYCLMPDHGHFLIVGLNERADQLAFITQFSRAWNRLLAPLKLARQPYDTVLREADRASDAFTSLADYIRQNPERAGLVEKWEEWPYSGCTLPGYKSLDPRKPYFQENFWKGYHQQAGE